VPTIKIIPTFQEDELMKDDLNEEKEEE